MEENLMPRSPICMSCSSWSSWSCWSSRWRRRWERARRHWRRCRAGSFSWDLASLYSKLQNSWIRYFWVVSCCYLEEIQTDSGDRGDKCLEGEALQAGGEHSGFVNSLPYGWKQFKDRILSFLMLCLFCDLHYVVRTKLRFPRLLPLKPFFLVRWWAKRRRLQFREPMEKWWPAGGRESEWLQTFLTPSLSLGRNLRPVFLRRLEWTLMNQLGLKYPNRSLKSVAQTQDPWNWVHMTHI